MPRNLATTIRYALGALAGVAALALRQVLNPLFAARNPYHTAWLALVFAAWYCGIGPSLVTAAIGAVGIWYWFLPPYHSFAGKDTPEISGIIGFLVFSGIIIALGESTRRSIARRQKAEEELRSAHQELEERVRERTAALEHRTAEVIEKAALLDMANDAILITTAGGAISYWNRGAERLYGWTRYEALGRVPRDLLQSTYPVAIEDLEANDAWEGEFAQTTRSGRRILVASRWTMLRDIAGNPAGRMEINTDITDRRRAEDSARSLSARILTLQDDERRRIARGLHDSVGQYLAALKMQLGLIAQSSGDPSTLIAEASETVDACLTETRTVSHLLHPPLLDEAGFGSAARWYLEGFGQRSGIQVNLVLPPAMGRLHREVETTLFRALQEGLTNVHRHSGSSSVDIRLELQDGVVQLEIQDYGHGMPPQRLKQLHEGESGLGIAGMRERVRELGGSLTIESNSQGTQLRIVVPFIAAEKKGTEPYGGRKLASA